MLAYPHINPVALQIGPLAVHWYGLTYLLGFFIGWGLMILRTRDTWRGFTREQVGDLVFYVAMGVIVGGRLGYMAFYAFEDVLANPFSIFMLWKGGMSFHGGVLGVTIAMWLWGRKNNKTLGDIGDFVVPVLPIGLGLGRIGNFINGELWGRVTDSSWGMVFPYGGPEPRHPSQLYEAFFEGLVLFVILWIFSKRAWPRWAVSGLFLMLYGIFRFGVEFFREADVQRGYFIFGWTEGQILCLPMIVVGLIMIGWAYNSAGKRKAVCDNI